MSSDRIDIAGLKLETLIGVPDEERTKPQTVSVNITIEPRLGFSGLEDDVDRTVDYQAVCEELKSVAENGERKLIETLAQDLARAVLDFDSVGAVTIEVRKFILPETDHVAVSLRRENQD